MTRCPVCGTGSTVPFQVVAERNYWRCTSCAATCLDPSQLPGEAVERGRYALHENHPNDPRYRRFLGKLLEPLLHRLSPGQEGLDYGCGPCPVLSIMLTEAGHPMRVYDPFFHLDPSSLGRTYDFITCTEVVEHFHRPAKEFARLDRLLRPGGLLAIMTCFQTDDERFADWYYRRDPTHVVFYREKTFHYLAALFGWGCDIPVKDVAILSKPIP
jgi:SAM-dependent methyltransferase